MISQAEKKAVQRALDANCNRAREGLRVAEDVARFILNDPKLLNQIKKLRHSVSRAEQRLFKGHALRTLHRDVAGDLGRKTLEKTEKTRANTQTLLTANLKRAQEALRSLEEFCKVLNDPCYRSFKKIRYECYKIEESLT